MDRGFPEPDLDELVRCALFFDGLPNDGIDDAGADRRTRLEQSAGGFIVLNGGGGEIFRNFFHLPDRGFTTLDIVRAFYRGFDPGVFRRRSDLGGYELGLAVSIARALAVPCGAEPTLSRRQVELAYPFFRCHHWMGLNNSVSTRQGSFSTPLIDLGMVRMAAKLPLRWKNAGLLESRLIAALHPRAASYRSSYGFRFSDGPDARARRAEWLAGIRPIFARPLISAARRRLQNDRVPSGLVKRCRALLPGEWRLDALLDLERLPNDGSFERALSIEVVSRCL
jgi:asparagine synthase (glutamine-hydrolysing)